MGRNGATDRWIRRFPGETGSIAELGGKGYSLCRMAEAGLAVPPGFVLTTEFFDPWFAALRESTEWADFERTDAEGRAEACRRLKEASHRLTLDAEHAGVLEEAAKMLSEARRFAVRSSSPEEDLEGSSFAGGYETVLGVVSDGLVDAVHRAFASCLDERIVVYKVQHGFDVLRPRIAVVVQEQVGSDVSGVGFSINPLTNDFDEAVINANWGLGETVVSGIVSPDQFVVSKVDRAIRQRVVGAKETMVRLAEAGGTVEEPPPRADEACLSDEEVDRIVEQLSAIEKLYGKPMDIEWCFEGGALYLLQARPITAYLSLPAELRTEAGARRRLYWDVTISVQGLFEPISVMGTSYLKRTLGRAGEEVFKRDISQRIETSLPIVTTGRIYLNLSNVLALVSAENLRFALGALDSLAADSIGELDEDAYRSTDFPWKSLALSALRGLPSRAAQVIEGRLMPEHARRGYERAVQRFVDEARNAAQGAVSSRELTEELLGRVVPLIFGEILPLFLISKRAIREIRKLFPEPSEELATALAAVDQSLPGNVTVEMGLELAELASLVPAGADGAWLSEELGRPSSQLGDGWRRFLDRYGHRGPRELDLASPRYRDAPELLFDQILSLAGNPELQTAGPIAIYERSQRERHDAFETVMEHVHREHGWIQTKRVRSLYRVIELFGGLRESPKYFVILALDLVRSRVLEEGSALVMAGRLDDVHQVFDLTLDDLAEAGENPEVDLRARAATRRIAFDRLAAHAELPRVVDSRGRIFRPRPRPAREGELAGQPVSPGIVEGPVKVLSRPDEKPLLPGDILVARATDPGWTPLFVNAAAIVLEVGGMLQHGALVAREYGKPCVVGVLDATDRLKDGQRIEVDGAAGIIRLS